MNEESLVEQGRKEKWGEYLKSRKGRKGKGRQDKIRGRGEKKGMCIMTTGMKALEE